MRAAVLLAALAAALALGGCTVAPPTGPNVMAMPGKDKDFTAFQSDDAACRQYASAQIGYGSPADAANASAASSATLGTILGAAAGAAIGAVTGNPAAGAAIGAGSGLFLGGTSGVGAAQASSGALQRRYDIGYAQCMAAKGESVPAATAGAYPAAPYAPAYSYYPYSSSYSYPYYPYSFGGPAFFGASFAFGGHGARGFHRNFHGNVHHFHH